MAEFGLLGQKLSYSLSKKIHEAYGLYDYSLFELQPDELDDFFENRSWKGINVTIPYKSLVRRYCSEETEIAKRTGAVNTIYEKNGRLTGDNTDFYGFLHLLNLAGAKVEGKKVLILGRGGAAKTVYEAMKERRAGEVFMTGRAELGDLFKMADADILVNATPVGAAKTELEGMSPCGLEDFGQLELVIDLVYNPEMTPLLAQAKKRSIRCIGGMEMLKFQAEKAAHRFMSTKNIVLIGMPGCGKSHIGRLLAEKTGRRFLDSDKEVFDMSGRCPAAIIENEGEAAFREFENQALVKFLMEENAVISTGGGIVTLEKNRRLLEGELTVWIQRDLSLLSTKSRPLSKYPEELYREREALYESCADITVLNNGAAQDCVSEIRKVCKI